MNVGGGGGVEIGQKMSDQESRGWAIEASVQTLRRRGSSVMAMRHGVESSV